MFAASRANSHKNKRTLITPPRSLFLPLQRKNIQHYTYFCYISFIYEVSHSLSKKNPYLWWRLRCTGANPYPLLSHAASQLSHPAWCWPHPSPCYIYLDPPSWSCLLIPHTNAVHEQPKDDIGFLDNSWSNTENTSTYTLIEQKNV